MRDIRDAPLKKIVLSSSPNWYEVYGRDFQIWRRRSKFEVDRCLSFPIIKFMRKVRKKDRRLASPNSKKTALLSDIIVVNLSFTKKVFFTPDRKTSISSGGNFRAFIDFSKAGGSLNWIFSCAFLQTILIGKWVRDLPCNGDKKLLHSRLSSLRHCRICVKMARNLEGARIWSLKIKWQMAV